MSDREIVLYLMVSIICITVTIVLLIKNNRSLSLAYSLNRTILNIFLVVSLVFYTSDILYGITNGKTNSFLVAIDWVASYLYLFSAAVLSYLWLAYVLLIFVEEKGEHSYKIKKKFIIAIQILAIPVLFAMIIFLVPSLFFEILPSGDFKSGPLYFLIYVFVGTYVLGAMIFSFICSLTSHSYYNRKINMMVALFPLPLIASIVLQYIFKSVPIVNYGLIVFVLLTVSITSDYRSSLDDLTGLSNRNQFILYYEGLARKRTADIPYYIAMIDVDNFKRINDTFGHLTGDEVLNGVASILLTMSKNVFPARYGGDEFVAIITGDASYKASTFEDVLRERIACELKFDFPLAVSIGIVSFNPQKEALDLALQKADRILYDEKKRKGIFCERRES